MLLTHDFGLNNYVWAVELGSKVALDLPWTNSALNSSFIGSATQTGDRQAAASTPL